MLPSSGNVLARPRWPELTGEETHFVLTMGFSERLRRRAECLLRLDSEVSIEDFVAQVLGQSLARMATAGCARGWNLAMETLHGAFRLGGQRVTYTLAKRAA